MFIFVSWVNDYWVQSSVWNSTIFTQRAERDYFWESVVSSNNGSWSHYFSECVVHVPFLKPLRESVRAVPSLFLSRSLYLLPFAGSQQVLRHGLWSSARLIQSALISTGSFSALQSRDETLYIVHSRASWSTRCTEAGMEKLWLSGPTQTENNATPPAS